MRNYIAISPYSRKLKNGNKNAKDYPYWEDLVDIIKKRSGMKVIQIGISGEEEISGVDEFKKDLKFEDLKRIIRDSVTWISVDNMIGHLGYYVKKPGIVIWGKSDPKIFGYSININLLKSEDFLRGDQFFIWEDEKYEKEVFVTAEQVYSSVEVFIDPSKDYI